MKKRFTAINFLLPTILTLSICTATAPAKRSARSKADTTTNSAESKNITNSLDELLEKAPPSAGEREQTPAPPKASPEQLPPEQLQGSVEASEQSGDTKLQGETAAGDNTGNLHGGASETTSGGQALNPKLAPTLLKGSAVTSDAQLSAQSDPDLSDKELMIKWDRWRNKFLRAVQLQVQACINHPDEWQEEERPHIVYDPNSGQAIMQSRFPMGTEAWFTCEVTADKRVKNLSIIRSSGFPVYDKAVMEGVRALEGTTLLQYPEGSKRLIVGQTAGIRTAATSDYQYHHFGDVERQRESQSQ